MTNVFELQSQYCSNYDKKKLFSYDIEQIEAPTNSLMHKESRFLFFTKGRGVIKINGVDYEIKPNCCVAIVPWEVTEMIKVEESMQLIKIVYNFNILNQNLKNIYSNIEGELDIFTEISNSPIIYCNDEEAKKFLSVANEIRSEVGVESTLEVVDEKVLLDAYLINKITELLILYIRIRRSREMAPIEQKDEISDKKINIFTYLYSHLSEKQTLKSVSSFFYMSESSLSKYCKKMTGYSFHKLIDEMRIVKAMNLLSNSEFPLSLIAELVGFNDASHLSKFFVKNTGLTPNQFRKENKNIVNMFSMEEKNNAYDIVKYLNSAYMQDIKENDVAKKFNISVKELNRKLIFTVEKNFEDFLNFLRVNYACELLKTTDYRILDIAISVGYNNSKTFYNNFVKFKSMSPSKFRKDVEIQAE
ncbi:Hypothetical protein ING2D1G_0948 [Peptoniphilus sp. ING2-D1G]|nr:Hypothetical protein ING2D1G_0948 [Peptoniphilus sp. ING2-D1G]